MIARIVDKVVAVGSTVSALGRAASFPAVGALMATVGIGSLSQIKGLLINKFIPICAGLVQLANA